METKFNFKSQYMRLGDFFKQTFESKGHTQKKAAKVLGMPPSVLSYTLSHKRRITKALAKNFEKNYGIPSFIILMWVAYEEEIYGTPKQK